MTTKIAEHVAELESADLTGKSIIRIQDQLFTVEAEELEIIVQMLLKAGFTVPEMQLRTDEKNALYRELWCRSKCVCSSEIYFVKGKVFFSLKPYPEGRLR